jgi:DNA-binding HxlR family transcriptional regulator
VRETLRVSMSEQQRDESGKFGEKVTDQDVLKVFDYADAPVLTAAEIADELPISQSAMNSRLNRMREDDLVDRKQTGARAVAWWATVAPRLSDEARRRADAADPENAISQAEMKRRLGMDG